MLFLKFIFCIILKYLLSLLAYFSIGKINSYGKTIIIMETMTETYILHISLFSEHLYCLLFLVSVFKTVCSINIYIYNNKFVK